MESLALFTLRNQTNWRKWHADSSRSIASLGLHEYSLSKRFGEGSVPILKQPPKGLEPSAKSWKDRDDWRTSREARVTRTGQWALGKPARDQAIGTLAAKTGKMG